jgi:ABC-type uncharacterized transport system ATPase subunit
VTVAASSETPETEHHNEVSPGKLVSLRGITKKFPNVLANDNVNLDLFAGEIHILLGENGAGKSTLMNILYGLYRPDEGEIILNGKPVKIANCLDAQELGIGMVHQHFSLIPDFTVIENIAIGIKEKGLRLNLNKIAANVRQVQSQYEINADLNKKVRELSMGERQRVEMLKLLYRGARILILDEPTSVLTPQESTSLFKSLIALRAKGKTIVLITHKLYEVLGIGDRVTVLRKGKVVMDAVNKGLSIDNLTEAMIGRTASFERPERSKIEVKGSLIVEHMSVHGDSGEEANALDNASLEIRRGEIMGIAGVAGNGQKELVEAISGLRRLHKGRILLDGADISKRSLRDRINMGVRLVPEDRKGRAVAVSLPLTVNSLLHDHWRAPFAERITLNQNEMRGFTKKIISSYNVVPPTETALAGNLSGGNLQKFIIGRDSLRDPIYLLVENPTAGLDVAATEFVRSELMKHRNEGKGVLLVSSDLDELLQLSDRITVMYRGRTSFPIEASSFDKLKIGAMMLGEGFAG